jgi:ribonuclease D
MQQRIEIFADDVSEEFYHAASAESAIAWDIETSGLDWSSSRIGTCQLAVPGRIAIAVLRQDRAPKYLTALLEDDAVTKVFHHAMFDLRFMAHHWGAQPTGVVCTKIASKVLEPELEHREHSLMPVLKRHLAVTISKDQQVSDWLAPDLTAAQISYAASDVSHLVDLYNTLIEKARAVGCEQELVESYRYLPTRVALDLRGVGDVFDY